MQLTSALTLIVTTLCITPVTLMADDKPVTSTIQGTPAGDLVLIQDVTIRTSLEKAWDAYTTKAGWEGWVVPLAEVDFRVGGKIRTSYNADGRIGDDSTNTLWVVNYAPLRFLTLQAELSKNWPEFMQEDYERLYNVIWFEQVDAEHVKITSYGSGYKDNEKYRGLMDFFIPANEATMVNLKTYLEGKTPTAAAH